MRFRILGSSSAGNSALICTEKCKVLLDAGFTGKRMEALLEQAGVALEQIDGIFITHEHSDHVTGLRGLTRRRPDIRVFANATTARVVQERLPRKLNWQIFENGLPFIFADLTVSPFSIPHDAYDPVGYHFCQRNEADQSDAGCNDAVRKAADQSEAVSNATGKNPQGSSGIGATNTSGAVGITATDSGIHAGRSLCWLTDLGYVTAAALRHASNCDLLVVEANHDPDMLERCETRSWSTKQRIRGRHGHLSNQAAYDLLAAVENPRWRHVCLAHISAECNSLQIVEKQFAPLRNGKRNLDIHIFDPASPAPGGEFDLRERQPAQATEQQVPVQAANAVTATDGAAAAAAERHTAGTVAAAEKHTAGATPVQTTEIMQGRIDPGSARAVSSKATAAISVTRVTQIEISLNF